MLISSFITIAIMIFIFVQSALPADLSNQESGFLVPLITKLFNIDAEQASFVIRKGAHFTEYTILGIALSFSVRNVWLYKLKEKGRTVRILFIGIAAWIIGALYAVTDEFHQQFVSGRSCEFRDMLIDFGGVLLGVLIISVIRYIRQRNKKQIAG